MFDSVNKAIGSNHTELCDKRSNKTLTVVRVIGTDKYSNIYMMMGSYRQKAFYVAMKERVKPDNEVKQYRFFTKVVLNGGNPHFPIIYDIAKCRDYHRIYSELANGDMESFLRTSRSDDEIASMWAQCIIAIMGLTKYKRLHTDLHAANVLFHDVPHMSGKYLHYYCSKEKSDIYVFIHNQFFVLWDFESMQNDTDPLEDGEMYNAVTYDLYRLSGVWERRDVKDMLSQKQKDMTIFINEFCKQARRMPTRDPRSAFHLLKTFSEFLSDKLGIEDVVIMNPEKPLPKRYVVNTEPYNI